MRLAFIFTICLLLPICSWAEPLTPEQQKSKQQGITLFMQGHESKSFLEPAAKAGDREAQYYLAESIRMDYRYINAEAYHWYEEAAKQGDLYAMARLGRSKDFCELFENCTYPPKEWLAKAKQEALTRAKQGDAQAMGLLSTLTGEFSWLEKSAEAGDGYYQYLLALRYGEGRGKFATEQEREETSRKWRVESAKSGYVPAMYDYGYYLAQGGKIKEGQEWVLKGVNAGDIYTVFSYASIIADDNIRNKNNIFQFPLDRVKGYALLSLIAEIGGGNGSSAQSSLEDIVHDMTPEEITKAKAFAEEWRNTHPPLSEFTPKLWY